MFSSSSVLRPHRHGLTPSAILLVAVMHALSTEATALLLPLLHARAPTQSEESKNNTKSGNTTIAIAASVSVLLFGLIGFAIYKVGGWYRRKQARNGSNTQPEMAQTSLLRPSTASSGATAARGTTTRATTTGTRPTRSRPRRQPSTQTVPEYSEQAGDEEMVLGKAEEAGGEEDVRIEIASPELSFGSSEGGGRHSRRSTSGGGGEENETAAAHYAATSLSTLSGGRRTSAYLNNASRTTLQDILNPAPELRMDRVDTYDTTFTTTGTRAPSIISSSEHSHLPLLMGGGTLLNNGTLSSNNESTLSLGNGFDEVALDAATPSAAFAPSASRLSSSSFFASPAYVNRSRSRSIDISRTISMGAGGAGGDEENQNQQYPRNTLAASSSSRLVPPSSPARNSGQSLDVPRPSGGGNNNNNSVHSRTASIMSLLSRRQSHNLTNLLPTHHQHLPDSRREALRNREISAPISETLVRTSYVFPKAGINPVQAAWLGSRDHINRLTTYLDTAPPAFAEEDALRPEMDTDTGTSASNDNGASTVHAAGATTRAVGDVSAIAQSSGTELEDRPSASNLLSQLEEESARLSSLVHQESQRRASLPAHMVALPPSLPVSPISPTPGPGGSGSGSGNVDWPISRATSLARAHSLARHRLSMEQHSPSGSGSSLLDRRTSIARRRVQSDNHENGNYSNSNSSSSSPVTMRMSTLPHPRAESPTPLSRGTAQYAADAASSTIATTGLRPVLKVETNASLH